MSPPTDNQREAAIRARTTRLMKLSPELSYRQARRSAEEFVDARAHLRGSFR